MLPCSMFVTDMCQCLSHDDIHLPIAGLWLTCGHWLCSPNPLPVGFLRFTDVKWPGKESTQAFFRFLVIPLLAALRSVLEFPKSNCYFFVS